MNIQAAIILVIFGAGGYLTHRKLVPALFILFLDKRQPNRLAVYGLDHNNLNLNWVRRQTSIRHAVRVWWPS